jgi:hypothetical protein
LRSDSLERSTPFCELKDSDSTQPSRTEAHSSFKVDHLIIEGFNTVLRKLPQIRFDEYHAITVRCSSAERYGGLFPLYQFPKTPPTPHKPRFVLEIGWPDKQHHRSQCDRKAVDIVPDLIKLFGGDGFPYDRIIVTPYLGKGGENHDHCFGKNTATSYQATTRMPDVELRSACACGNGDKTGCKQEFAGDGYDTALIC